MLCCEASLLEICLSEPVDLAELYHLQSKEVTCPLLMPCRLSSLTLVLGSQLVPEALAAHLCETCVSYASQPLVKAQSLRLHLFSLD